MSRIVYWNGQRLVDERPSSFDTPIVRDPSGQPTEQNGVLGGCGSCLCINCSCDQVSGTSTLSTPLIGNNTPVTHTDECMSDEQTAFDLLVSGKAFAPTLNTSLIGNNATQRIAVQQKSSREYIT